MPEKQDELLPVVDIDVCLDPGLPEQRFTLWPDDEMTVDDKDDIHIVFKHPVPGRLMENVIIRGKYVRWLSRRSAMRKLPTMDAVEQLLERMKRERVS